MTEGRGGNEEESEIQKFEYLENKKGILDEIKITFHKVFKDYHLLNKRKIADTSFKLF